MGILVWWVPAALTALLAIGWAGWVRRVPRDPSDHDSVEAYARFRAALARSSASATDRPLPPSRNTRPPRDV